MAVTAPSTVIRQIEQLVDEHRALRDEPLLLAIYFEPQGRGGDIFLFEVIDGFGGGAIDDERHIFEISYASTPSFPMPAGQKLHLILTNPEEFGEAVREQWSGIKEVQEAVKAGKSITVFADPAQPHLEAQLNG